MLPKKQPGRPVTIAAGPDVLRLPLKVNLKGLNDAQLAPLLAAATDKLGASFFRGQDLFDEVLADARARADIPSHFLAGPYLSVFIRQRGDLGVSVSDRIQAGDTIYASDQLLHLCAEITPERVEAAIEADEKKDWTARRPYASDWQRLNNQGLEYSQEKDCCWYQGRTYDRRSAHHNGLIGAGDDLRAMARSAQGPDEDSSPSP